MPVTNDPLDILSTMIQDAKNDKAQVSRVLLKNDRWIDCEINGGVAFLFLRPVESYGWVGELTSSEAVELIEKG